LARRRRAVPLSRLREASDGLLISGPKQRRGLSRGPGLAPWPRLLDGAARILPAASNERSRRPVDGAPTARFPGGCPSWVIRYRGGPIRMSGFARSRHELNCENVANGHKLPLALQKTIGRPSPHSQMKIRPFHMQHRPRYAVRIPAQRYDRCKGGSSSLASEVRRRGRSQGAEVASRCVSGLGGCVPQRACRNRLH
jgi:hypothetical protein